MTTTRFTLEIDEKTLAMLDRIEEQFGCGTRKEAIIRAIRIAGHVTRDDHRVYMQNGSAELKEIVFL
jgi:metal-responsive CopG/Arc/MetJ family transcriptional regulator